MKKLTSSILLSAFAVILLSWSHQNKTASIYDLSFQNIETLDSVKLSSFKGKKILIVNVASKCGYTPQYTELQELYYEYSDKLVVIGFPCNQFLHQEPGTKEEILKFCQTHYGVTFPLSSKIDVKGHNQDPIYTWLTKKELNGVDNYHVSWNFNKFLIDENGKLIAYFDSDTKPMSEAIVKHLK